MELNSRRMYDRRWLTKKFSSESAHVKHFLSTSLPERFSEQAPPRHLDFLLNGGLTTAASGLDSESRSASSDSMLQYDMSNRAQLRRSCIPWCMSRRTQRRRPFSPQSIRRRAQ